MSETMRLPVKLDQHELAAKSNALATACEELVDLQAEAKEHARKYGEAISKRRKDVGELSKSIRSKQEERDVPIDYRRDHRRFTIETVRLDTNEIIDQRAMDLAEIDACRQERLPYDVDHQVNAAIAKGADDATRAEAPPEATPTATEVLDTPEPEASSVQLSADPFAEDPETEIDDPESILDGAAEDDDGDE